jgi:hypothetical protein
LIAPAKLNPWEVKLDHRAAAYQFARTLSWIGGGIVANGGPAVRRGGRISEKL